MVEGGCVLEERGIVEEGGCVMEVGSGDEEGRCEEVERGCVGEGEGICVVDEGGCEEIESGFAVGDGGCMVEEGVCKVEGGWVVE